MRIHWDRIKLPGHRIPLGGVFGLAKALQGVASRARGVQHAPGSQGPLLGPLPSTVRERRGMLLYEGTVWRSNDVLDS